MIGPHIVLSIPELLLAIFGHLSVKELVVAALVCKAWSAPAVDTIWRTQTIMLSCLLAKLAPIDTKYRFRHAVLKPKTPITQGDWSHFLDRYANRVTKLKLDVQLDTESMMHISTLLETFGGLFCGDLISLEWPSGSAYDTGNHRKLFDLLPATKLQTVRLAESDTSRIATTPLSQLAHRAPHVREIITPCQYNSFDFSVFSQLQFLSFGGYLSKSDYRNLAHCPYLRVLRFENMWAQVLATQQNNGTAITFPRLEELSIHPSHDSTDDMLLQSVMPALRSLEYRRQEMGPCTIPFLNGIVRTSPYLKSITITAGVPPLELELVQHDGVRNLFFENRYRVNSELDARHRLSTIARTFPKLEKLEIIWDSIGWHWSTIQMLGNHLSDLRHLRLSMDVSISLLSGAPKVTAPIRSLTTLEFGVLRILPDDIDAFISYLVMLCPNVRDMHISEYVVRGDMGSVYGGVLAFIEGFFDRKGRGELETVTG
ncbi:hypothetical protein FRB95_007473 [Tulasnella sp. JGI-2019a]|nr:hypothetical protein FRB95_007473 [Tulasnella sp. JGI-2019a]